jgi:hypothetical protein
MFVLSIANDNYDTLLDPAGLYHLPDSSDEGAGDQEHQGLPAGPAQDGQLQEQVQLPCLPENDIYLNPCTSRCEIQGAGNRFSVERRSRG